MAILSSTNALRQTDDADEDMGVEDVAAKSVKTQDDDEGDSDGGNYAQKLESQIDDNNLAKDMDESDLATLADLVLREYDIDENSRAEWKEEAECALKFATQESEPKQYPWPKASNVIYPLITAASLQFGARAYPAIIQNRNVAKGVVWGSDDGTPATQTGKTGESPIIDPESGQIQWLIAPGEKTMRATKIGEHMSWQLLEEIPEWESQTDQLLHQLPIVGGAVRKTYWDFNESRTCSCLVPLMNIVWNKHAPSFEKATRITEILSLYPHEIKERELADETFIPIVYNVGDDASELGQTESGEDSEAPKLFLEQHRRYDLDNDGYAEPYIVTVHKASRQVVRIVARYEKEGIFASKKGDILRVEAVDYYTLYPFLPDLNGGSYPLGFGHLLKPMNEAINTTLNQMFDAGHLQIAGGGFIGTKLSLAAGPTLFRLGEYIPVNNSGASIRDSVFPIPFPGPSNVLFELLGFLVSAAEKTASIQDILTGESAKLSETQPTTLLALIEQGMKVYTAIYKRIYRALKGELGKIYRLNRLYLELDTRYKAGDEWKEISKDDYRLGGGVEPIADPTMTTDMQKLARAGVLLPLSNDPMINHMEVLKRYLDAAGIQGIDKLLQPPPDPMQNPMMQLEMAMKQAELGKARAQELQFQSAAFLNMANARAIAGSGQMDWIDKQLEMMRLHIESVNASVRAAGVDAQFEGHKSRERIVDKQAETALATAKMKPAASSSSS